MPSRPPSHHETQRTGAEARRAWRQQVQPLTPELREAERLRHTRRWLRVRVLVLARDPLCRDPYGTHAASGHAAFTTDVDHILPLRTRPDLAFTLDNLQGLCTTCHGRKTRSE